MNDDKVHQQMQWLSVHLLDIKCEVLQSAFLLLLEKSGMTEIDGMKAKDWFQHEFKKRLEERLPQTQNPFIAERMQKILKMMEEEKWSQED